jgi:hypothetical protein
MSVVHIILHGLIALVPATDSSGMANHMTALLVDARNRPAGFQDCFAPHQPSITVQTPSTAACVDAGCTPFGLHGCTCSLIRKEVSLQAELPPEKAGVKQKIKPRPERRLPFNEGDALDFSYVANLSSMGYQLNTELFDSIPPPVLIARMSFPFESVSACSLGTRRDEGSNNVHPLGFRPLNALEKVGEESQALAQEVLATFETTQNPVTLTVADFGGGNPQKLTLQPIDGEYQIELANMRPHEGEFNDLPPDHICDAGVERDFAFFYDLVKNPPDWRERPIPHVKYTVWKSAKDLEAPKCVSHRFHFPNSHPICALASFTR